MKIKRGYNHAIFNCYTCGKSWQDFKTARVNAYNHAKMTGHKVRGGTGTFYHYN